MTADELLAQVSAEFLTAFVVVVPWLGAGVGAGITLMILFLGIRAGIGFFRNISEGRRFDAYLGSDEYKSEVAEQAIYDDAYENWMKDAMASGWDVHDAIDAAEVAGDLAVMKHRGEI